MPSSPKAGPWAIRSGAGSCRSRCSRFWAVCSCGFGIPAVGPGQTHAWNLLALILTITVVLKIYYVLLFPWVPDGSDALGYHTAARALVEEGLLTRHSYVITATASAYAFLLAAVYAVAGIHPLAAKIVQVVPAVGIAVFVVLITKRLFGDTCGSASWCRSTTFAGVAL